MRKYKLSHHSFALFILVMLILVGCSSRNQQTPFATSTMMTGEYLEEIPLSTPISGSIFTVTPSPSSVPSPTSSAVPTLELTPFAGEIHAFLTQGENCSSPCVFGIVSGQTSLEDAMKTFAWLRHPLLEKTYPNGSKFYNTVMGVEEKNLSIVVDLFAEKRVVKNMIVGVSLSADKHVSDIDAWKAFSPKMIIEKYGVPSRVGIYLSFPTEEGFPIYTAWYDMILFYDKQNFAIVYFHGLVKEEDFIKACPATDLFTGLKIYYGKDLENPPFDGLPLEKVTLLTLEQFTDLLKEESGFDCFEISKAAIFGQN